MGVTRIEDVYPYGTSRNRLLAREQMRLIEHMIGRQREWEEMANKVAVAIAGDLATAIAALPKDDTLRFRRVNGRIVPVGRLK